MKYPILFVILSSAMLLAGCSTACCTKPTTAPVSASTELNLAGQWHWTCCEGNFSGEMTLQQDAGKITGRLFDENDTTGGAIEGSVSGNTVKFTRTWGEDFRQDYTLTLSADGNKIDGTFDGTQDTRFSTHFEATRK